MAYGTTNVDTIQSSTANTPVVFKDGNGTQIGTLCRAWVSFTPSSGTKLASFNVSSVTRNNTGFYTIALTNAMPDANYVVSGSSGNNSNVYVALNAISTSSFQIYTRVGTSNTATDDSTITGVAIFR